nr:putative ribonuclease H-like domain-containing protein [Tanacetum cinerariifolium]
FLIHVEGHSHKQLEGQGYVNSRCSKHMTGNISYLTDFKEFDGGYVSFKGGAKGGKITCKGIIKLVTDMSKVDKIKGKKDETEHGNEKSVKDEAECKFI